MTFTLLILGILVGCGVVVFQILWMVSLIHSAVRGSATLATSRRSTRVIVSLLQSAHADTAVIYDLGCGKGGVTCTLKKEFSTARVIGIDSDPIQLFFARLRAFFRGQSTTFRRADFFSTSLADATCVFAYLPLAMMPAVGTKLLHELKSGTIVVTNAKKFGAWSPINAADKFFVYRKN